MADAYWRNNVAGQQQQQPPQPQPPVFPSPPLSAKRPRAAFDMPSGHEGFGNYAHEGEGAGHRIFGDASFTNAPYDRYLRNMISSYGGETGRPVNVGFGPLHPVPAVGQSMGMGVWPGIPLPPNACCRLYVEGLPSNCTLREVSHIFRPFIGYKEVRLVTKESRQSGGNPLVLCFVDFQSPVNAFKAMQALQGYKMDEHDLESSHLKLQFARYPGSRSGGERCGKN